MNRQFRTVSEVAADEVIAQGDAHFAGRDAAEQMKARRLDADPCAREAPAELLEYLGAHFFGIGPALIEDRGHGQTGSNGKDQASDQPLPPRHRGPLASCLRRTASCPT